MRIENRLKVVLNENDREEVVKAKETLIKLQEIILSDPEGKSIYTANSLKNAADLLDAILDDGELY